MKLRLRQIALAVADLEAATSQASHVLGLGPAYQDPAIVRYGLRNAVYAIGNTFLEFVSPITENTTVGRLLAKQGGDCGYMVILQTDAADEARARIDAAGGAKDAELLCPYKQIAQVGQGSACRACRAAGG